MLSTMRRVFGDADYRRYLSLLILAGAAGSAGMPLVPLFLLRDLHAGLAEIAVITLSGLLGVAFNIPLGRVSDRLRSRRPLMCALAATMAAGWALLGFAPSFWIAVAIYAVLLAAPAGALSAQIYASLGDTMRHRNEPRPSTVNATLRGGYSFGWIAGPLASTGLAATAGLQAAFWIAVAAYAIVAVLTLVLRETGGPKTTGSTAADGTNGASPLPLVLFACGLCAVMLGEMLRGAYLSIYVVEHLGQSTFVFGVLAGSAAAIEVGVFPLMGALADRFGIRRVIAAALAFGVVAYAILASSTQMWQVWVFYELQLVLFVATSGLGLSYVQGLAPGRAGMASATFFSAQTAAKPASGLVGFVAIGTLGLPGIFWVPAVLCAVCLVAFTASALRPRREPVAVARERSLPAP